MNQISPHRIPIWIKLLYSTFVAVLVPIYWKDYGPTNFLYFCDVALLLTVVAIWVESSLLTSMATISILVTEVLWSVDLLAGAVGMHITGMTVYMFNGDLPWVTRGLSFFHLWLPILLLWMLWKLGYDRRAFVAWTIVAWVLIAICFLYMPAPPPPRDNPNLPVNINYVFGLSDEKPQQWMPEKMYLACLVIGLPTCIYLPTHLLLRKLFSPPVRFTER